ncbi:MAG: divergent PAP2 family protein [Lachnospiraceae bacterium]|nr:divergent PAP2 family protein [Lachnospiraceae bacterium]MEE1257423.1 divergent PAP2 family protein [Lachnospiraceae bacterium]
MEQLSLLFGNRILLSAVSGWLMAQVLKTIIHFYFTKKFVAERLVGSGGMPSCHSATVCSLATSTGIQFGVGSFEFAIATIFAIVVMYDAIGVRRETGNQAKIINEMMEIFESMNKELSTEDKLKELVGHTPLQVLVGSILGILIAVTMMSL